VLSYSVEARLAPFWDYLGGLGVQVRAVWGGGAQLALQPVSLPLLPGRRWARARARRRRRLQDVAAAVVARPSLLGLDVDASLRKIVEYLQYTETPPDKIVEYLTRSI
jgi:hypothetical protein